jgi:hypothetical protein
MQSKAAIIHKYVHLSLLLRQFKNVPPKMAVPEAGWSDEDVPLVIAVTRETVNVANLRAVCNLAPTLPTRRSSVGKNVPLSMDVMAMYFPNTISGQIPNRSSR